MEHAYKRPAVVLAFIDQTVTVAQSCLQLQQANTQFKLLTMRVFSFFLGLFGISFFLLSSV